MAIPKEYLDSEFDFGFSTTDDDSTPVQLTPAVTSQEISEPILERIRNLEVNVGEVLNIVERLENASTPLDTDDYKALIEKDVKAKLASQEVEPFPLSSSAFATLIRNETPLWTDLVRENKLTAD